MENEVNIQSEYLKSQSNEFEEFLYEKVKIGLSRHCYEISNKQELYQFVKERCKAESVKLGTLYFVDDKLFLSIRIEAKLNEDNNSLGSISFDTNYYWEFF